MGLLGGVQNKVAVGSVDFWACSRRRIVAIPAWQDAHTAIRSSAAKPAAERVLTGRAGTTCSGPRW